jgi:hypothetical protein
LGSFSLVQVQVGSSASLDAGRTVEAYLSASLTDKESYSLLFFFVVCAFPSSSFTEPLFSHSFPSSYCSLQWKFFAVSRCEIIREVLSLVSFACLEEQMGREENNCKKQEAREGDFVRSSQRHCVYCFSTAFTTAKSTPVLVTPVIFLV